MSEEMVKHAQQGGQGEALANVLTDPHHVRADLRIIRRALREGWLMPQDAQELPVAVLSIALNPEEDSRARVAAAKVIVDMEKRNLEEDLSDEKNRRLDQGKPTERIEGVEIHIPGLK